MLIILMLLDLYSEFITRLIYIRRIKFNLLIEARLNLIYALLKLLYLGFRCNIKISRIDFIIPNPGHFRKLYNIMPIEFTCI